jgi:tetraacyldisaccharide 4'-kinase
VPAPNDTQTIDGTLDRAGGAQARYLALVRGQSRGVGPAVQRVALYLASFPYGLVVRLRNLFYDLGWFRSQRAPVPVVSVGNLSVGGTGKTPCVEYVAGFYRDLDLRVAILSRGYGAEGGRNDEALLLEENLPDVPHLQGPDRLALARIAVEELESQILVLDDGLQHRRLARDLDVVLLDATAPWGYAGLLPRGLLREPRSGLRRAGVVVLTRCDQVAAEQRDRLRAEVHGLAPSIPVAEARHAPVGLINGSDTAAVDLLRGRPVAGFCGLANPDAFRRTLIDLGSDLCAFRTYPDHHPYTRSDVDALHDWARSLPADSLVVTTQKDLVKLRLPRLANRPLWAVRVRLAGAMFARCGPRRLARELTPMNPMDLHGLSTYDLASRPSKVFVEELGKPVPHDATFADWIDSLPHQLAGRYLRQVRDHLVRAHAEGRTVVAALGGHVIKTGCAPYLIDWIQQGLIKGVTLNGAAAIHDLELALVGKTSEDVAASLPEGRFGMARETADVFAVAALRGAQGTVGLGAALGAYLAEAPCLHPQVSLVLAAFRAGIPCTIHVALGTDVVHMHPHVSGAALGAASMIDFRRLCSVVATMAHGVWLNLGSAVLLPEVLLKAVSIVHNFGHSLEGLVTVNVDKESRYRTAVNVLGRPAARGEGIELTGHHEILLPLLHAAVACKLRAVRPASDTRQAA